MMRNGNLEEKEDKGVTEIPTQISQTIKSTTKVMKVELCFRKGDS